MLPIHFHQDAEMLFSEIRQLVWEKPGQPKPWVLRRGSVLYLFGLDLETVFFLLMFIHCFF